MKSVKKALFCSIFLIFSLPVFSQISTSNSVYNFLNNLKCNPKTQQLFSTDINQFPYNISIDFPKTTIGDNHYFSTQNNLYLIFSQEEVLKKQELLNNLVNYLNQTKFNFNISISFLYGENQIIDKEKNVYGLNSFIETINTNEDSTVIFVNLNNKQSSITTTSNGTTSPSYLIKAEHDIFFKYDVPSNLPFYYVSQLYKYNFNYNRQLNSFFELNIPGIILNFSNNESDEIISNILIESIISFSKTNKRNWEQHFLMINIVGKYRLLSENVIVQIIIILIFCFLFVISFLGFINSNLKKAAWNKIRKIWYVVPITFLITILSFFIGKGLFILLSKNCTEIGKIFLLGVLQIILSFIFISSYYIPQVLMNNKYEPKSIDFMIFITIFINQFIFMFCDISLFPLFMFVCILAVIGLSVKKNIIHMIIFILMFIPFGLYAKTMLNYSDISELSSYLINNNFIYIYISLAFYPSFLIYFRILSALKELKSNKKYVLIYTGIIISLIIIIFPLIGIISTKKINKKIEKTEKNIIKIEDSNEIFITYSDKKIFDDKVRNLQIELPDNCLQASVQINGKNSKPILYSSDDFEVDSSNSASFLIPYCPPKNLSFRYGTDSKPTTIIVSAISNNFNKLDKEEFYLYTKSITIN